MASLSAWIILGLASGYICSRLINSSGIDRMLDLVLGIVGAVLGGWAFSHFGMNATGTFPYSMLVAVASAAVALMAYHYLVRSGR